MRRLIAGILILVAPLLHGATVTNFNIDNSGTALNSPLVITPLSNPTSNGVYIVNGPAKTISQIAGKSSFTLFSGDYQVEQQGRKWYIAVPDDTNIYNLNSLAWSNQVVYSYTNGRGFPGLVRVTPTDTTPSVLGDKVTVGAGLTMTTNTPTGNAKLNLAVNFNTNGLASIAYVDSVAAGFTGATNGVTAAVATNIAAYQVTTGTALSATTVSNAAARISPDGSASFGANSFTVDNQGNVNAYQLISGGVSDVASGEGIIVGDHSGNASGLTNIHGTNIQASTIGTNQMSAAAHAAYLGGGASYDANPNFSSISITGAATGSIVFTNALGYTVTLTADDTQGSDTNISFPSMLGAGGTNAAGPSWTLVQGTNTGVTIATNANNELILSATGTNTSGTADALTNASAFVASSGAASFGNGTLTVNPNGTVSAYMLVSGNGDTDPGEGGVYGSFYGNAANATNLHGTNIQAQTIGTNQMSTAAHLAYLGGGASWTIVQGTNTGIDWSTNASSELIASVSSNLSATIIGTIPPANLATNAAAAAKMLYATSDSTAKWDTAPSGGAPLGGTNTWTGTNVFSDVVSNKNVTYFGSTGQANINASGIAVFPEIIMGTYLPFTWFAGGQAWHAIGQAYHNLNHDNGEIGFGSSTDTRITRLSAGVIRIGTNLTARGTVTATNGLILPSTTATIKWQSIAASNPPTSGAGTAFLFSATNSAGTAEIFTMDGAGVIKQISEHAMDAPDQLIDDNDEAPNISKEILMYTGKVRWINRSRSARQQEMTTKLALNSLAYYQFTTGKSASQWTNSNAYGFYTNAVAYLDPLTAAEKQIVIVESFAEYNTRNGLTNGNGLIKANWAADQARFQAEYATSYTNATVQYTNDYAAWTTNSVTQTNLVAPVYPSWTPPAVQPVPSWLTKRGAN